MNRAQYLADRAWTRKNRPERTAQGLPHHPDGSGWAMCPDCEGAGSRTVNRTASRDPQWDEDVECGRCFGRGEVRDGDPDPLFTMASARLRWRHTWWHGAPLARMRYGQARQVAMSPLDHPLPGAPAPATEWRNAA